MSNSYLPRKDAALLAWSQNFLDVIGADPTLYGLTPDQGNTYNDVQGAYATAYAAANHSETRTKANIEVKNNAKAALVASTRQLVDICQAWPGMTDDKRAVLQITIRDNSPTPVPPPATAPLIDVLSVKARRFELRLRDAVTSDKRKPAGVQGATLFSYVGEDAPASLSDWKFEASTTKTDIELEMPVTVPAGSRVWFTAFWFNRKSESGPATDPIYSWTNNGGVSLAA